MIELWQNKKRQAILVGVRTGSGLHFEQAMEELAGLCEACGLSVAGKAVQKLDRVENATYIGSGKLVELGEMLAETEADSVVFLNTLTPSQLANLAHDLEVEVLDKTGLILNIFSERARTAEAKLQVEYAKLEYMLPRLVGLRQNLSRQGGTGGSMSNKGAGEKQIELDRRHIEKRMAELRKELRLIETGQETKRKRRMQAGVPLVALCGYTNAGKSTLMNRLLRRTSEAEEKEVLEQDMLFATLDTTVRRIKGEGFGEFLLSDTVGFIEDLPHDLVKAFRSTLSEIRLSDLILQVVDYSDDNYMRHIDVTEKTLRELSAAHLPMIYVMNKAELVMPKEELPMVRGNRIYLSAANEIGLSELLSMIQKALYGEETEAAFLIPYKDSAVEHKLRTETEILFGEYREEGVFLKCRLPLKMKDTLSEYLF